MPICAKILSGANGLAKNPLAPDSCAFLTFSAKALAVSITTYASGSPCTSTLANNGTEAVLNFKQGKYDLVLMDMQMPDMDGVAASEQIREYEAKNNLEPTPIIAFTANATEEDKQRCYAAGMNDFMTKPINMDKFQQVLSKWAINLQERPESKATPDATNEHEKAPSSTPTDTSSNEVAAIDLALLDQMVVGDAELKKELVETFLESSKTTIDILENAQTSDEKWVKMAHKLKGSAAAMGMNQLSSLAAAAELSGIADGRDKHLALIQTEYERVLNTLKSRV